MGIIWEPTAYSKLKGQKRKANKAFRTASRIWCSGNTGNYNDSAERMKLKDSGKEPSLPALPCFY